MRGLYHQDLAYIQAAGFGAFGRGAAPGILRLLRSVSMRVHRVVDAGCGAGPLTAALVEAGFQVTGIDVSAELLRFAERACPQSEFIHGSIYNLEIPSCEAILAVGEPLTYHDDDGEEDRVRGFLLGALRLSGEWAICIGGDVRCIGCGCLTLFRSAVGWRRRSFMLARRLSMASSVCLRGAGRFSARGGRMPACRAIVSLSVLPSRDSGGLSLREFCMA
jgi:SAM-dependent methyltransferase